MAAAPCHAGLPGAASGYLVVVHDRSGWSISLISLAITGYYVLSAIMTTFVGGDAFDRFGPRRVPMCAVGALAIGLLAVASAAPPWQLCLGLGVMAVGWAGTSGAGINAIVAPWFDKKRGMAVSMAMNGASSWRSTSSRWRSGPPLWDGRATGGVHARWLSCCVSCAKWPPR